MSDSPATTAPTDGPSTVTFRFDMLTTEAHRRAPMVVTEDGSLLIAGRSRWLPVRFSPDLLGVVCTRLADNDGIPPTIDGKVPEHVNPTEA